MILDLKQPLTSPLEIAEYPLQATDDHTIEVIVRREQGLNPLFAELSRLGIEVLSMRSKSNRLEELFLDMVEKGDNK